MTKGKAIGCGALALLLCCVFIGHPIINLAIAFGVYIFCSSQIKSEVKGDG